MKIMEGDIVDAPIERLSYIDGRVCLDWKRGIYTGCSSGLHHVSFYDGETKNYEDVEKIILIHHSERKNKMNMVDVEGNMKRIKTIVWHGKVKEVECEIHSFAWSGSVPNTGVYRCVYCGKLKKE